MIDRVWFILLKDVPDLGKMHFEKVEWWTERPFCVCVRYSVDGQLNPLGIRIDMDKKAALDDFTDAGGVDKEDVLDRVGQIWDITADALRNKSAYWYKPTP
jgi:hypothetical protein